MGTADGSILPFIIFYAFKFMLSYSLFTPKHESPPSSTLLFLLKALIGKFIATFFSILQCCLHLLPSSFNLGWQFLWILFLMHKHILKDLCQY
jgi:hypothetical protein